MKKEITVFTTTFNRGYCLPQVYQSLISQTNQNFIWLIIDDGSTDSTKEIATNWIAENKIEIQYILQKNQGMHGGHNTAYENCKTEFNVCIDSDDFMPNNAVEIILKNCLNLPNNCAGLLGLDADKNNTIIGTKIPKNLTKVKLNELYTKFGVLGDKKVVYKTEIVKKYPKYPIFENEKFVPLDYLYLLIDQDYYLKPINEVLCIVEYQLDGSTKNILNQYRKNPKGFAFSRISRIKYGATFIERFKNAIHLVSSALFANNLKLLLQSDKTILVFFAIPLGIILNFYIRFKTLKK